jgi:hypothetical protein
MNTDCTDFTDGIETQRDRGAEMQRSKLKKRIEFVEKKFNSLSSLFLCPSALEFCLSV